MANPIDLSAMTINPQEATEVSAAVFEKTFVETPLSEIHEIETGVFVDQQIAFIGNLPIGGEALSGCTPAEQEALTLTQKYWTPKIMAGRYITCNADYNKDFKLFKKAMKINPDYFDSLNSEEQGVLMLKIAEMMSTSIFAKIWFSDTAADDFAGGGNFTNGTNLGIFNQIDGYWAQIIADAGIYRYTIAENAGATYVAQELAAGKSNTIFRDLYKNADPRLTGDANAQILVTKSIWDNYLDYAEDTESNGGIMTVASDGVASLNYRGIKVVKLPEWDRLATLYQNDGTVVVRPHKVVMTTKENIPFATLAESDLSTLESHYDQTLKSIISDFAYSLDAKVLEDYAIAVAY